MFVSVKRLKRGLERTTATGLIQQCPREDTRVFPALETAREMLVS
jgi:hypothetical protein